MSETKIDPSNWSECLKLLECGKIRAAEKINGKWITNTAVKEAILAVFRAGELTEIEGFWGACDKHNLVPQKFPKERKVRLAPGGSAVRPGSYIAPGVVIIPPAYVNIGAYVDERSMVDSHALVGSCAQIGKNVHLSAGVQIGGVLEPIGMNPVIIEDDAFIGAGSVIVEGIIVGEKAVIAPGVTLSRAVPVYDCVNQVILERGASIPPGAVVVPGTRPISKNTWAREHHLNLTCAIIIKYRDEKSDRSLELESSLRP